MNNKFDELTKGVAQSTTRRVALKRFGTGLAGVALAFLGLANNAEATKETWRCYDLCYSDCLLHGAGDAGICRNYCHQVCRGKG